MHVQQAQLPKEKGIIFEAHLPYTKNIEQEANRSLTKIFMKMMKVGIILYNDAKLSDEEEEEQLAKRLKKQQEEIDMMKKEMEEQAKTNQRNEQRMSQKEKEFKERERRIAQRMKQLEDKEKHLTEERKNPAKVLLKKLTKPSFLFGENEMDEYEKELPEESGFEDTITVVVVGDDGTGKSTLVIEYAKGHKVAADVRRNHYTHTQHFGFRSESQNVVCV